jgi:hypothetical protein
MKCRGSIETDPQIGRNPKILLKRSQAWISCTVVLASAGFFLLTLREGSPEPYQRLVDSIFHSWEAMGSITIALWIVRRISADGMPRAIQILSGFLLLSSALITGLGSISWMPLWELLKPLQISQTKAQPLAAFAMIAMWFLICAGILFRGIFRWIRSRYEHHGFAVRSGPLYFYFRRRRTY